MSSSVADRRCRVRRMPVALALIVLTAACGDAGDADSTDPGAQTSATDESGLAAGEASTDDSADDEDPDGAGGPGTSVDRGAVTVSTLDGGECPGTTAQAEHPDVVGVELEPVDGAPRGWDVSVTLCSLYDTPDRYADAWRVSTPDGEVLGVRELLHDHATEQPFTRSLGDPVEVPPDVSTLVVEGRDLANGWGGATLEVELP